MKRVLVAPLDWGLGHASRCVPIIRLLLQKGCTVVLAGNGRSLELLKLEFPRLPFEILPAYDPRYPAHGSMALKMIRQIPKFFRVIRDEHAAVQHIVNKHRIDVVMSDNRYGCWSEKVTSVFITHQSNIMMPKRFGWLSGIVRRQNQRLIRKFSFCWIPDFFGEKSLAGVLADVQHFDAKMAVRHIGVLSRFHRTSPAPKKYDLLCIFSGPEPQRSKLEELIVSQLGGQSLSVAIVRGVPTGEHLKKLDIQGDVFDMLNTGQLQQLIDHADVILARSGFSTVMDLASLKKRAIFIPTPGQTEQEYLAERLCDMQIAYSIPQREFDLRKALQQVDTFKGFADLPEETTLLERALAEVLQ